MMSTKMFCCIINVWGIRWIESKKNKKKKKEEEEKS